MSTTSIRHRHVLGVTDLRLAEVLDATSMRRARPLPRPRGGTLWVCVDQSRAGIIAAARVVASERGAAVRTLPTLPDDLDALSSPLAGPSAVIASATRHVTLLGIAARSSVRVINAGTDEHEPLDALGDLAVLHEVLGDLRGRSLLLAVQDTARRRSLAEAAVMLGMRVVVLVEDRLPADLWDAVAYAALFGGSVHTSHDAGVAASTADVAVMDIGPSALTIVDALRPDAIVVPSKWSRHGLLAELLRTPHPFGGAVISVIGAERARGLERALATLLDLPAGDTAQL